MTTPTKGRPKTGRQGFHFVVTISESMKVLVDERASALGFHRNGYIRMLILQDLARDPESPFTIYPTPKGKE